MKLIDADELCRKFNSGGGESEKIQIRPDMPVKAIINMTLAAYRKCLFAEIGKMPAAYDVDKVVEQLEEMRDISTQNIALNSQENDIDAEILRETSHYLSIIEIVKSGGIE